MSKSIANLISFLGIDRATQIFNNIITYPRTTDLDGSNKELIELSYKASNFMDTSTKLKTNIELKHFGEIAQNDILDLLRFVDKCKESMLLAHADNLIIVRGNFSLIKFKNIDEPNSGRSIVIDYSKFRSLLEYYYNENISSKSKLFWSAIFIVGTLSFAYLSR